MTVDLRTIRNEIRDKLQAVTDPTFTVIDSQRPQLPPDGGPFACFWRAGLEDPPEGGMTLGNRMNGYVFQVMLFWHPRLEATAGSAMEDEINNTLQSLSSSFWGDVTLGGNCSYAMKRNETPPDYGFFPLTSTEWRQSLFYSVDFELLVVDLEGEAISA